MPRFRIYGIVEGHWSGRKYLGEYEAETKQEAKDMAIADDTQAVEVTVELASDPDPIPGAR